MLCVYGGGVMPGRRAGSVVGKYTMPRAQNRAAKGSILFRRRSPLHIWVYFLSKNPSKGGFTVLLAQSDNFSLNDQKTKRGNCWNL